VHKNGTGVLDNSQALIQLMEQTIEFMPLFTRENACEVGRRGSRVRWSRKPPQAVPTAISPPLADSYAQTQALKLRRSIKGLLKLLAQSTEVKDIVHLANAIDRLQRTEAALSGRASPGSPP